MRRLKVNQEIFDEIKRIWSKYAPVNEFPIDYEIAMENEDYIYSNYGEANLLIKEIREL